MRISDNKIQFFQQDLSGVGQPAADDEYLRVRSPRHSGQRPTQTLAQAVQQFQGQGIARLRRVAHVLCRQIDAFLHDGNGVWILRQRLFCQPEQSCGGAILLQASMPAAAAPFRLVRFHTEMSDFPSAAVAAVDDPLVHHQPTAHAGAQGHQEGAVTAPCAAPPQLSQGGGVHVVGRPHVPQPWLQRQHRPGHVEHIPAQIDAAQHRSIVPDWARYAHTHPLNRTPGDGPAFHRLLNGCQRVGQDETALFFCPRRYLPLFDQRPIRMEQAQFDGCPADIHAKCVRFHICYPLKNRAAGAAPQRPFCRGGYHPPALIHGRMFSRSEKEVRS